MYRVKNNYGDYCNIFSKSFIKPFPIAKRHIVGEVFETTDINVANQYKEWLELAYPDYKFTVVEVSE